MGAVQRWRLAFALGRRRPEPYTDLASAAGYVWREADQRDYVCVRAAARAQTRVDDAERRRAVLDDLPGRLRLAARAPDDVVSLVRERRTQARGQRRGQLLAAP